LALRFRDATNVGMHVEPLVRNGRELAEAADMTELVDWLTNSTEEDYVNTGMLAAPEPA
jgi:hypothetical protein